MWPYWLMFLLPALATLGAPRVGTAQQRVAWVALVAFFTLMIGFRHEVGGDWFNYLGHFRDITRYSFTEVMGRGDPGYYGINWLIAEAGGSIYWVNFLCAIVVMAGVSVFARSQPMPWLALLVAVPYLIIVVAMGYSRQGAALGLAMLGLTALANHDTRKFVLWVVVAALFHKSAVLLLPIAALAATRNKLWTALWVGVTALGTAYFFVFETAETLWKNYVEADYESQGGLIRVAMNAVPAAVVLVIVLFYRDKLFYNPAERRLWVWLAIFSLACIPLVMLSSTATDRVALYFIPIQLFVFSRLPLLASGKNARERRNSRFILTVGVVAYYALVQYVWLNHASHAFAWLPYDNYLFHL